MYKALGDVRWFERLPVWGDRSWIQLVLTLAICGAALLLRFALGSRLPPGLPYATFFPAVILAAFLFGVRAGALAAILGGLLGWIFFIRDPATLTPLPGTAPSILLYAAAALLILVLFHGMQTATANLVRERERSQHLAATSALLFRELQHRVSNNLQVAAGLLALQKKHVGDAAARAALEETVRRIGTIGRISRQLYRPSGEAQGVRALLEPLCADVVDACGKRVAVAVSDPDGLSLAPDAAVPVALIVAEAVANAIEHGFADRDGGVIDIECRAGETGGFRIEVHDNGRGLPGDFDLARHAGTGLAIAATLAGQLDGRFEMVAGRVGATARLRCPAG